MPTAPEHRRTRLRNWEYFTREILPLVAARGYFPTVSELTREGRYDLIAALRRYHGGVRKAARKLGVLTYCTRHGHKSNGFWTEERIIAAYRDVIRTHSCTHWPSPNDLTRLGYGDLRGAMQKLGFRKVREHLTKEGIALDTKPRKLDYLIPFTQQYPLCNEIFTKGELFFYFLGLVAADGAFVSTRHEESVELCLKKGDREILETLRTRISPSRPIHRKPNRKNPAHEAVRFKLNDRRIISLLKDYMHTQDKSRRLTWPEGIPDEHLHHFIRGYVDGDGTLGVALTRQSVRAPCASIPLRAFASWAPRTSSRASRWPSSECTPSHR